MKQGLGGPAVIEAYENKLDAILAENERLREALFNVLSCTIECPECDATGISRGTRDACRECGGLREVIGGTVSGYLSDIRAALAGGRGDK